MKRELHAVCMYVCMYARLRRLQTKQTVHKHMNTHTHRETRTHTGTQHNTMIDKLMSQPHRRTIHLNGYCTVPVADSGVTQLPTITGASS